VIARFVGIVGIVGIDDHHYEKYIIIEVKK
jgi:hypothetical protein